MKKISLEADQIKIEFVYEINLVNFIRSLPDRTYRAPKRAWFIPIASKSLIDSLSALKAKGFEFTPEVENLLAQNTKVQPKFQTELPLLDFQLTGSEFLYEKQSAFLGDEVGTGKTIQTLAVMESVKATKSGFGALIFVPAILKEQWRNEILKFVPEAKVIVIKGTPKQREKLWNTEADYYLANYEQLLRDFPFMSRRNWDFIIADEAQKISSPTAKQGKLIKKLKADRRLALSGTPISNTPQDLWNVYDFIRPGVLGNYYQFMERYCVKNMWGSIVNHKNLDELKDRIQPYMIRRLKEDVMKELPPITYIEVPFDLSADEQKLQDQIKRELLFEITPELISKITNPETMHMQLPKMMRLRQLANGMELLGDNTHSSKMEALSEIIEQLKPTNRKIIIFTEFAEMANILSKVYTCIKITGDVDNSKRQALLDEFNTGEKQILIMTSAGQYGLNIQSASVIIHYDLPWSISRTLQREGRAHRKGQTENVLVYSLLGRGTIDEYISKKLLKKKDISDRILIEDLVEMLEL